MFSDDDLPLSSLLYSELDEQALIQRELEVRVRMRRALDDAVSFTSGSPEWEQAMEDAEFILRDLHMVEATLKERGMPLFEDR